MAFTLNNIASDKQNPSAKRGDAIRVHLDAIKVVDGFNVRIDDDELREHIAGIAGALAANLPVPPVEVWVNPESGDIELVDGHCRYHAYREYAGINPKFDGYVSAEKFEGTPFQRKMRIASSNKQLKLKPIELGRLYIQARDELGASRKDIATEAGMSLAHVDQMIKLVEDGSEEVHAAVESGVISATEAVKLVRDHGADAPAELERRKEAAKEIGKGKVTAKVAAPKAPIRPKVDMVVSAAVVLVNRLEADVLAELDNSQEFDAGVPSHALADLLHAVREMQQAGKPLDADKQMELIEGDE
jgi:ParB-like chromosome segregation protein Spo0J